MIHIGTRAWTADRSSGFTLPELLIVIALSSMILLFSLPSFTHFKDTYDLRNAALRLRGDMRLSQRVAASRYIQRVIVIGSPDVSSYTIFDDDDRDSIHDNGERLQVTTLPGSLEFTSVNLTPPDSVIFVPAGTLQSPGQGGTLGLQSPKGQTRWIRIWSSGSVDIVDQAQL